MLINVIVGKILVNYLVGPFVDEGPGVPCEQEDLCCTSNCTYAGPWPYCVLVHKNQPLSHGKCDNGWTGATYNFKTVSSNITVKYSLGQCIIRKKINAKLEFNIDILHV